MREIISGGAATILVSHSIAMVQELCTKILWLDHGHQIGLTYDVKAACELYKKYLNKKITLENIKLSDQLSLDNRMVY